MLAAHADLLALQHEAAEIERALHGDLPGRGARPAGRSARRGAGPLRGQGRLPRRGRDPQDPGRPRVRQGRPRQADRPVLRRLAHPDRAGEAAGPRPGPAAAGRADQPPGPRSDRVAGGVPQGVRRLGDRRLARPLLPGSDDLADGRAGARQADRVRRQLLLLPGREGAPLQRRPDRLRAPAARAEAPAGVHRPVPGQGDQGDPGQEPREGAGEDRAGRGAAASSRAGWRCASRRPSRRHREVVTLQNVVKRYGAADRVRRPGADAGARRAAGAGRPERRRQEHAAADAGRGRAAGPGHAAARRWRDGRVLRPGPDRDPERRADRPGGGLGRRARRLGRGRRSGRCSGASASPATTPTSRSASSPAARRPGWPSPGCCSSRPTCCCWTSRPTTWTWPRARSWSGRCASSRARS